MALKICLKLSEFWKNGRRLALAKAPTTLISRETTDWLPTIHSLTIRGRSVISYIYRHSHALFASSSIGRSIGGIRGGAKFEERKKMLAFYLFLFSTKIEEWMANNYFKRQKNRFCDDDHWPRKTVLRKGFDFDYPRNNAKIQPSLFSNFHHDLFLLRRTIQIVTCAFFPDRQGGGDTLSRENGRSKMWLAGCFFGLLLLHSFFS